MPDAAPVITATRPHSKARCLAASKGEKICAQYASARAHAHAKRGQGGGSCDEGTLGPTVLGSRCSESTSVYVCTDRRGET